MKYLLHASCFAFAALLASGVPAQETGQQSVPKTNELIQQLGDPSYRERRAAEEELRKLGASATDALREAADRHADAEVRWRAGRLLRQIEEGASDGRLRTRQPVREDRVEVTPDRQGRLRTRPFDHAREMQQQFDEMFRQLERDFGIDVPRRRFFHDDFFRDLEEQMQQLRTFPQAGQGESMQMQIGPDGVRVEVKRIEDGQEKTDVYEAPDMESFRAKYPDVAKRHFGGGLQFRGFDTFGPFQPFQLDVRRPGALPPVTQRPPVQPLQPIDTNDPNRLGVMVGEVAPQVRAFLGLDAGQGLYVESTVDGSLAAALGIEAGDILLEIAGREIGAVGDVREALSSVEAGAKVEVVVNRRGSRKQLTATKPTVELAEPKDRDEQPEPVAEPKEPATPPQSEPAEGPPKTGGKLRRIR